MAEVQLSRSELLSDFDHMNQRFSEMERELSSFRPHYKELTEFIDPRRGRYFVTDRNKGDKRFKNIINNKATMALRKATAGMLAGVASPSRPWFIWTTYDKELATYVPAKQWMSMFQRIILMVLAKSNFYNMAPLIIRELLQFGTGCMTHVDDFDDVARFYAHTVGSYMIAQDHKLRVNTLAREFQMTSLQMINKFGLDNVSQSVRTQYDRGNYGSWHTVRQLIEPNPNRNTKELGSEFMPYRSVYFEKGAKRNKEFAFLRRSGYRGFPAYVPRWELAGEDIYSVNCPGMTSLGDIKMLQQQEKDKEVAIQKSHKPPLQGPPSLRNQPVANLPGGVTIPGGAGTGQKIESIYNVDPRINEMVFNIQATERRIDEAFYVDMFMAITDMQGIQPKNELQLSQINEERLLQIGPVLEQVHGEWLDRMVRRVAEQVLEAGIMPDAPPELQGQELDLQFVSSLAMAQKAVTTASIERTLGFAANLADAGFDVRHKFDAFAAVDEYADLVGTPVRIIVPSKDAEQAREAEQQAMQRAQQMEMAQQAASAMKTAADAKLGDDNVLSSAIGREQ